MHQNTPFQVKIHFFWGTLPHIPLITPTKSSGSTLQNSSQIYVTVQVELNAQF